MLLLWRWRIHMCRVHTTACSLCVGEEHWQLGQNPAWDKRRIAFRCRSKCCSWITNWGHVNSYKSQAVFRVNTQLELNLEEKRVFYPCGVHPVALCTRILRYISNVIVFHLRMARRGWNMLWTKRKVTPINSQLRSRVYTWKIYEKRVV
jgi:hypothetical protein